MLVELGHFALMLALMVALIQGVLPLLGTLGAGRLPWIPLSLRWGWLHMARASTFLQWALVSFAFFALEWAFLHNDFSVAYVVEHSNSLLPRPYQFAALWGGHEGSLLLWVFLLGFWSSAVAFFSRSLPLSMVARVLGVMGLISFGFLCFILSTSDPFVRVFPPAMEGRDLNPLLQDPGLVIHPPMLYMGYVGMSVAFAFAIAALLAGRLDAAWARWSRPWTVIAWTFLSLGIGLGSWWAYYELGWGGWWFWDPVENASLMPWLVGTALIHSLMVTEKRGTFKAWTVLLAIAAFSLSLLGTFLVRSGVLTSVHAFASDPARGIFILVFLSLVVGSSLSLFAWRAPQVGEGGFVNLVSRETFLLTNSILMCVATLAVLLGTLYPLVIDALGQGKLSVGPPYFNLVFAPIMVPLIFIMVPGSLLRWREAKIVDILPYLWVPGLGAVVVSVGLCFWMGAWSLGVLAGFWLGAWVALAGVQQMVLRLKRPGRIGGSFWGMQLAHLGLAIVVMGVTGVKSFEVERDVRMGIGDEVQIQAYTFRLLGMQDVKGPNYEAVRARVQVLKNGQEVKTMLPEKRHYYSSAMPMTEAAIDSGVLQDLYVSLGDALQGDTPQWSMRVYYKPFVPWLWAGVLVMVLGGFLAALDRRYRMGDTTESQGGGEGAQTDAASLTPHATRA